MDQEFEETQALRLDRHGVPAPCQRAARLVEPELPEAPDPGESPAHDAIPRMILQTCAAPARSPTGTIETRITLALLAFSTAGATRAERINVANDGSVARSVARLTDAVEGAGARVFTTFDFARGSASVGQTLPPTTGLIFGSPKIAAPTLQQGQAMALDLSLRILFFEDPNGQTSATCEDPTTGAPVHGPGADHPAVLAMKRAPERFSAAATSD